MNRREALQATLLLLGGTVVGAQSFLTGCASPEKKHEGLFSPDDLALLDTVGETIIPTTPDSPGARAAAIGAFIQTMVTDCYDPDHQKIITDGIADLRTKNFLRLSAEEQHNLLADLNKTANAQPESETPHYFRLLKQLTTLGYFTSEPGATKALNYLPIPGRYDGCVPYEKGSKAWAT